MFKILANNLQTMLFNRFYFFRTPMVYGVLQQNKKQHQTSVFAAFFCVFISSHGYAQSNTQSHTQNHDQNQNIEVIGTQQPSINGGLNNSGQPVSVENIENVPLNTVSPQTLKDFVTVIDLIRREYYYPTNDEYIFKDAMIGMLKGIAPYAEFLDAKAYQNLQAFSKGDLAQVGINAEYDKMQKFWVISNVELGSPAIKAGIKPQYFLHQINQTPLTSKFGNHDVEQMLRGIAGSQVELTVSNQGRQKRSIILQRNVIEENKVSVKFDNGLATIKIPVFQNDTKTSIVEQLSSIDQPINGVLIDVRDNPGGVLDAAVDVVGLLQKTGGVVIVKDREGNTELVEVIGEDSQLMDVPVVVLQNRYSASASEVLASSLQVNNIATVVGEYSYGKGSIQEVLPINNTEAIKLTVAHYLQADGKKIDGVGVKPDIELTSAYNGVALPLDRDVWLEQSIDIIRNLMPRSQFEGETKFTNANLIVK